MAMIDKVMDELLKQGFMPKHENFGIAFKYQMTNYLYVQDKKDEDYFSLYVPYIFNVNSENMAEVLSTINAINNAMKVIKLVVTNDNIVWACFEEKLPKDANLEDIIPFAVHSLFHACRQFNEQLNKA